MQGLHVALHFIHPIFGEVAAGEATEHDIAVRGIGQQVAAEQRAFAEDGGRQVFWLGEGEIAALDFLVFNHAAANDDGERGNLAGDAHGDGGGSAHTGSSKRGADGAFGDFDRAIDEIIVGAVVEQFADGLQGLLRRADIDDGDGFERVEGFAHVVAGFVERVCAFARGFDAAEIRRDGGVEAEQR